MKKTFEYDLTKYDPNAPTRTEQFLTADGVKTLTSDANDGAVLIQDSVDPDSLNPVTAAAVASAVAGASGEVPVIGNDDNGKVLTAVVDGSSKSVAWETPSGSSYDAGDGIAISEGTISAKVDGTSIGINASGELEAIGGGGGGGGIPYNVFKCRYSAGTSPDAYGTSSMTAMWKDTESADNIWYIACYQKAANLFQSNTGLLEVISATIQLPLLDTSSMFSGCSALTSVPLFNLSSATNTSSMFGSCTSLTSVPLFDLSSATNPKSMFGGCSALTSVPLFDLSSATDTSQMFRNCTSLTSVPLFDLSSSTTTSQMFSGCTALTSVPLFDLSSATITAGMFSDSTSVETGALALYQQVSTQATPPAVYVQMFSNCGSKTVTGAQELAQIPASWGGTGEG